MTRGVKHAATVADHPRMDVADRKPPQAVGGGQVARSRGELLERRAIKSGWLCVAVGLLIPLFALGGVYYGVQVARAGRRNAGYTLVAVGLTVFTLRLAFYLSG